MASLTSAEPDTPQRVANLWFDDATIIFQSENKLFRVHRSILSSQSSVFREMFDMPPATNPVNIMDGCVLIQLPDPATSIQYFFKAIFDASFFEAPPTPTKLDIVLAIARLSHKYNVRFLRRRALAHLESYFALAQISSKRRCNAQSLIAMSGGETNIEEDLEILQIVFETDAHWLLPLILYKIARHDLLNVMKSPKWASLRGSRIHDICIASCIHQTRALASTFADLLPLPFDNCLEREKCLGLSRYLTKKMLKFTEGDPFEEMEFWDEIHRREYFCTNCGAHFDLESTVRAKDTFWENLPQFCGLPPWKILHEQRMKEYAEI
ncbi:hypothetical protein B0H34DRAFT_750349 [Crassisporium funariophilum]|nr:hypothetical protein B0H34DRAFT_750349 [Crassisporium funariophilum]